MGRFELLCDLEGCLVWDSDVVLEENVVSSYKDACEV
jgi:hypothetical protein